MYFVARLNKTPEKVGTFVDSVLYENKAEVRGIGAGIYLAFATSEQEVIEMQGRVVLYRYKQCPR